MDLPKKCRGCGKCCMNGDWLDKPEVEIEHMSFRYGRCEHLNEKNECDIYDNRPIICRQYKKESKACLEALNKQYVNKNE